MRPALHSARATGSRPALVLRSHRPARRSQSGGSMLLWLCWLLLLSRSAQCVAPAASRILEEVPAAGPAGARAEAPVVTPSAPDPQSELADRRLDVHAACVRACAGHAPHASTPHARGNLNSCHMHRSPPLQAPRCCSLLPACRIPTSPSCSGARARTPAAPPPTIPMRLMTRVCPSPVQM